MPQLVHMFVHCCDLTNITGCAILFGQCGNYALLIGPKLPVTTGGGCPAHGSHTVLTDSLNRC